MMNQEKMKAMKNHYDHIEIPDELEFMVRKTLSEHGASERALSKRTQRSSVESKKRSSLRLALASAAAVVLIFTAGVNTSQNFAEAVSQIPGMAGLVKVVSLKTYFHDEARFSAEVTVPKVEGLGSKSLEKGLNAKYLEEGKALYAAFEKDMAAMKKTGGVKGVYSDFEVVSEDEQLLVVARHTVETQASGYETVKYDTIDKQREVLLTLKSLFKNDDYIKVISAEILKQMHAQMKADSNKIYWTKETTQEMPSDAFKAIHADQSFYINKDHQLVIVFNEYEVAPGYMGVVSFTLPTEALKDLLVDGTYIK